MERKKRILVLGAGESGVGAALLAKKQGYEVVLCDNSHIKDKYKSILTSHAIAFYEEVQTLSESFLPCDIVVKSPGVPNHAPSVQELRQANIPVISEIEFAYEHVKDAVLIGISGSNGKTTTSTLIYQILKDADKDVCLCGNVGHSFALSVAEKHYDYYVIEISSFQLDDSYNFRPNVSVLLNITPDHLDRYGYLFQKYIDAKFRLVQKQQETDTFVFWTDDAVIKKEIGKRNIQAHLFPFGSKDNNDCAYIEDDIIHVIKNKVDYPFPIRDIFLQGQHNMFNVMASIIVALQMGIRKESICHTLQTFKGVPHRMQLIRRFRDISFINDSKATNVNSCWYALDAMTSPVVLILGGTDKGNDYSEIDELVKTKCRILIFLGVDNSKLETHFRPFVNAPNSKLETICETQSMIEAVSFAFRHAHPGDNVLLSPCCASFDLFNNYEDRGEQFINAVNNLKE